MKIEANSPDEYISKLPAERQEPMQRLRQIILDNIPAGFQETMSYGMIGYVVPHSIFPDGYHCNPELPLPFLSIASQKNFIGLYHLGLYADTKLMEWFVQEYPKHNRTKLDAGKSCIRFKKINEVPYDLIAELARKITVEEWIACYQNARA